MNTQEYLLTCLSEECIEISKNIHKALRFGLDDCKPNTTDTNMTKIKEELDDLFGVLEMCAIYNVLHYNKHFHNIQRKKEKLIKYMNYAKNKGTYIESIKKIIKNNPNDGGDNFE